MPTLDLVVVDWFGATSTNWKTNPGNLITIPALVANLQTRGSGVSCTNSPGFNCAMQFLVDTTIIEPDFTINSIVAVASAKGVPITQAPVLDVAINAAAGLSSSGDQALTGSYADYFHTYPFTLTATQLWSALAKVDNSVNAAVDVQYLALTVDYSPPSSGKVSVYVAGAYPVECSQPPAKRFKPFGLFDPSVSLEQDITTAWMLKYGKPPAGYVIWSYYRAAAGDYVPGADSPTATWPIDPWPPPN